MIERKYFTTEQINQFCWNYSFSQARLEFDSQLRYVKALIDMLYSNKALREKSCRLLWNSIHELDRWAKEIEIALRKEKDNENENL